MSQPFPDSTMFRSGKPIEGTPDEGAPGEARAIIQPRFLLTLLVCALLIFAFSISEVFAAVNVQAPVAAADRFDPADLVLPAEQFLTAQAAALGKVHAQVTPADRRLSLPACARLEAFLPPGATAQGRTTVGVRCLQPTPWTVYLQAQVQVIGTYLVAARPLAPGQLLEAGDLVTRTGDLAQLPAGALVDAQPAIGRTLSIAVGAGQPLRHDSFKTLPVIQPGQAVHLVVRGTGFQVSGDGIALAGAGEGQNVAVRTPRGTQVSGIARSGGIVELHP